MHFVLWQVKVRAMARHFQLIVATYKYQVTGRFALLNLFVDKWFTLGNLQYVHLQNRKLP